MQLRGYAVGAYLNEELPLHYAPGFGGAPGAVPEFVLEIVPELAPELVVKVICITILTFGNFYKNKDSLDGLLSLAVASARVGWGSTTVQTFSPFAISDSVSQ